MSLTFTQANAQLAAVTTADQLRTLIAQVDIFATGSTTVLYSGKLPNGNDAGDVTRAMLAQGADIRILDTTDAAKFLDLNQNPDLLNKLKQIFGDEPGIRGTTANQFLFGAQDA
jgi:hypothetical protein